LFFKFCSQEKRKKSSSKIISERKVVYLSFLKKGNDDNNETQYHQNKINYKIFLMSIIFLLVFLCNTK